MTTTDRNIFIFDVDGTLTPSRGAMDAGFKKVFLDFCSKNEVYLATGSDAPKTIEQVGEDVFNAVVRSYNCSGNSVWENGVNIYNNDWRLEEKPWKFLESKLLYSKFSPKTGWHFDERPGLCNFSIVGRKAKTKQREEYVDWDERTQERWIIAEEFNQLFSEEYNIVAQVAGETGLDIMPIGKGKQQIIDDFPKDANIMFVGDKTMPGGNDHDISLAVKKRSPEGNSFAYGNGKVYQVESWEDTQYIIKKCIQ